MSKGPPSVLMLTPDRQVDRRILLEAGSLEGMGWNVRIIAMPLDRPAPDDRRVVRIGTRGECRRRETLVLQAYRGMRGHLAMNGALMQGLKRLAWRYLLDQESFYMSLFFRTASCYPADIVVAHDLPMLPVACRLARRQEARVIYDSHELFCEQELSEREKRKWAAIEAKYIGTVDKVVTVNQSIASELSRRYGLRRVEVILNAERSREIPKRSRIFHEIFGLAPAQKVLLFQGGLSAGRNLEVLVDSMSLVSQKSLVVTILGDGGLLRRLKNRTKRRGLLERVFFHPAVPQDDLLRYTASADAGIIPYQATCLNNYWCTPNKLFEFIAAGLPILATDLPELRAFVEDQRIGMVGEISSPDSLAKSIDGFFGDVQRLAAWKENIRRVRSEINWEREEENLVKIYQDCLASVPRVVRNEEHGAHVE